MDFQYHSSQLTLDQWFGPQSVSEQSLIRLPVLSHPHRRVLTLSLPIQCRPARVAQVDPNPDRGGWGSPWVLAFTIYSFTSRLLRTISHPFTPHAHLHCPPCCSTNARLLDSRRLPFRPPMYAINHTILIIPISCKGQPGYRVG